jgi:hypothetical protein
LTNENGWLSSTVKFDRWASDETTNAQKSQKRVRQRKSLVATRRTAMTRRRRRRRWRLRTWRFSTRTLATVVRLNFGAHYESVDKFAIAQDFWIRSMSLRCGQCKFVSSWFELMLSVWNAVEIDNAKRK